MMDRFPRAIIVLSDFICLNLECFILIFECVLVGNYRLIDGWNDQ